MFNKILIANRGEIACRVIRTAQRLGISTVAVYSQADADARHVALADEAVEIGPAESVDSYLRGDRIIRAAQRCGAEAIHPGYGFLSENADFAEDCAKAGLVFVGPDAKAIRAMGSKSAAKRLMSDAGVPVIPGYHGEDQSDDRLRAEADRIGYPVLLKPTSGGGGKGMRVVESASEFHEALAAARRESRAAFGDWQVLIEKFVARSRHIEVQVFADAHGNVLHLFERDCSVQRRHQKIVEEAPAPGLTDAQRATMGQAAVDAAIAVGYLGAGTVEFLVDRSGNFYFMEMNTRLQVEHPVTELVTGQDLIEWQLLIAIGDPLPVTQADLSINGHAIEARVYAEDPSRDFQPASGRLLYLRWPSTGSDVRIDSGVREGDSISVHYDPMIAKLIVWSDDRVCAVSRLQSALRETQIAGIRNNLTFLRAVAVHEEFVVGGVETGFIDNHGDELIRTSGSRPENALAVAALYMVLRLEQRVRLDAESSRDPGSPWHDTTGWRLNKKSWRELHLILDGNEHVVTVEAEKGEYWIESSAGRTHATGRFTSNRCIVATLDGKRFSATVVRHGSVMTILHRAEEYRVEHVDPVRIAEFGTGVSGGLIAPMPGKIAVVNVDVGDRVHRGETLLILEAMKVEHAIVAPCDGVVERLHYVEGDQVDADAELLLLSPS